MCQPSPLQQAWDAYSKAAQSILDEYDLAQNEMAKVDIALNPPIGGGGQKLDSMTPDGAINSLEQRVVPHLSAAAAKAAAIQFPHRDHVPVLVAHHDELIAALKEKRDAYLAIVDAYKHKDSGRFGAATRSLGEAGDKLARYREWFYDAMDNGGPSE